MQLQSALELEFMLRETEGIVKKALKGWWEDTEARTKEHCHIAKTFGKCWYLSGNRKEPCTECVFTFGEYVNE